MDLSGLIPVYKKFNNEIEGQAFFSKLSAVAGKKIDIISIYAKGSSVYYHFYFDRSKLALVNGDKLEASAEPVKKVTKKKTRKRKVNNE